MIRETLKENLNHVGNEYITRVHLIWASGQPIGTFNKEDAIRRYGNMQYFYGYSEGRGLVDVWINNNTKWLPSHGG